MKRLSGYYWVKFKGEWTAAEWSKHQMWGIPFIGLPRNDADLEEIDERRIKREPTTEEKNAPFDIKAPSESDLQQYLFGKPEE